MIYSMTGYGRGEYSGKNGIIRTEIKTVNHRFFDLGIKLPEGLSFFEDKVREYLQKRLKRGRIYLAVSCRGGIAVHERPALDEQLAASVVKEVRGLKKKLKLSGEIDINSVMSLPGMIRYEPVSADTSKLWKDLKGALDKAMQSLLVARAKEGKTLAKDLWLRVDRIGKQLKMIEKRSDIQIGHYKKRLAKRVKEFSGGLNIDKGRLEQEVAIFAKNCDITEEITRLKSHITGFKNRLHGNGEKGKAMDFIAQELSREANTIGSKSGDIYISRSIITIKSEIDKIREQLKNIE